MLEHNSRMDKQKQFTYRNTSNLEQVVVGVGVVAAGGTITVEEPFDNPNFEQVKNASVISKSEARRHAAMAEAKENE